MSSRESAWNGVEIAAFWKRWEGETVDGQFFLGEYLGGATDHAVFRTEYYVGKTRTAAIKLVLTDPSAAEGLSVRWGLVAELSHPHLARILSHASARLHGTDFAYTVMEYAEEVLAQVLADRPLTIAETQEMLEPLLDALVYVHSQGFTHGHLCPANILAVGDQLKLSSDSLCPFQMPGSASPADDIGSLGGLLCEALTRQKTPSGALPQPFREIAGLCLRTNPDERPTAAQLSQRLRQPATLQAPRAAAVPRYLVWVFLLGLTVGALMLGNRFLRGHSGEAPVPATSPAPASSAQPTARPEPFSPAPAPPATSPEPSVASSEPTATGSEAPAAAPTPAAGPAVLEQVLPDVDLKARDTIHGTVRINVRVRVDEDGRVEDARFDNPPSSSYLGNLTLEAARRWRFQPGKAGEWLLRFQLLRTETKVSVELI